MPARKHKRQLSTSDTPKNELPSKRRRPTGEVIDLTIEDSDNDSDEDMFSQNEIAANEADIEVEEMKDILAQIAAQEASEKLAKDLQAQASGSSSTRGDAGVLQSDEEMARRLAAEWEAEDGLVQAGPSTVNERADEVEEIRSNNDNERTLDDDDNRPPDTQLPALDPLFTAERPCSKCGTMVLSPRGNVVLFKGDEKIPPSLSYLLHAPCRKCKTNHCRGCFKAVSCNLSCKGKPIKNSNKICSVNSCCAEIRAIAIFETLGGFDWQYIGDQQSAATRVEKAASKSSTSQSIGPGGTGYGAGSRGRYAYGSMTPRGKTKSEKQSKDWDEIVIRTFRILVDLLPRPYADDAEIFDMLPHSSIGHLLALSCVPEYLVSLLRNDSVSDWIQRNDVYHEMLGLLRRLAECELTVQVLVKPRFERKKSPGITAWMWGEADIDWARDSKENHEMALPLFDYFRKLTKQCESFVAGASQAELVEAGDASDEEAIKAVSLCGDIIAVRDDLVRAMGVLGIGSSDGHQRKGKGVDRRRSAEEEYMLACEQLAFKHIEFSVYAGDEGRLSNVFAYAGDLTNSQMSTRVPKDRFHLIKELATMGTSLPEGVFVRVDETRNDALKAMIAGPPSTPYAGGLFEFDIFLPMTYPNTPPLVKLRTTGGGSVRFNPNLYNCGKVCLSLLGTWPGGADEQWKPGKSTILQVLISIQSMILVEAPYFNEPGYGQVNLKNPASVAYNKNIQVQTTRWAILDWLKDLHKGGMWADVVASHFLIKQDEIRKQLEEWHGSKKASSQNGVPVPESPYFGSSLLSLGTSMVGMYQGQGRDASKFTQQFEEGLQVVKRWGLLS